MSGRRVQKRFLWELLVERGYAPDRKGATAWIMAGKVRVGDQKALSAGTKIAVDAEISVIGAELKYVGKGGLKLAGALAAFGIDAAGCTALDTGASTGGFTDCWLQHGAAKVYAIDVGYGQLAGKLRADPRVVNLEKTNISDVTPAQLDPRPSLASVDLSYLSLKQAIPIIAPLLAPGWAMLCLVKPLFEVEDATLRQSGRIEAPEEFERVLHDLVDVVLAGGWGVAGVTYSPVTGNAGTREFFLHVTADPVEQPDLPSQITSAVERVLQLDVYKK